MIIACYFYLISFIMVKAYLLNQSNHHQSLAIIKFYIKTNIRMKFYIFPNHYHNLEMCNVFCKQLFILITISTDVLQQKDQNIMQPKRIEQKQIVYIEFSIPYGAPPNCQTDAKCCPMQVKSCIKLYKHCDTIYKHMKQSTDIIKSTHYIITHFEFIIATHLYTAFDLVRL